MSDIKTSKNQPGNYKQVLGTGRPVTITCSTPSCWWTDAFWLTLRASSLDHRAHLWDTKYCNTSTFSDLGLVILSGWFLAILCKIIKIVFQSYKFLKTWHRPLKFQILSKPGFGQRHIYVPMAVKELKIKTMFCHSVHVPTMVFMQGMILCNDEMGNWFQLLIHKDSVLMHAILYWQYRASGIARR